MINTEKSEKYRQWRLIIKVSQEKKGFRKEIQFLDSEKSPLPSHNRKSEKMEVRAVLSPRQNFNCLERVPATESALLRCASSCIFTTQRGEQRARLALRTATEISPSFPRISHPAKCFEVTVAFLKPRNHLGNQTCSNVWPVAVTGWLQFVQHF